jgi:uncharacterized protein YqgV (UPF0045/DUF77 family)
MSSITAQISLYPLGTDDISSKIQRFTDTLIQRGLSVRVGPMSSHIEGESELLFDAVRLAFDEIATGDNKVVLTATFSNACPPWFEPEEKRNGE